MRKHNEICIVVTEPESTEEKKIPKQVSLKGIKNTNQEQKLEKNLEMNTKLAD